MLNKNRRKFVYFFDDIFTGLTDEKDKKHPWCLGPECCDDNKICTIAPGSSKLRFTNRNGVIHDLIRGEYIIVPRDPPRNNLDNKTYFSVLEEDNRYIDSRIIFDKIKNRTQNHTMEDLDYFMIFPSEYHRSLQTTSKLP